MSTETALPLLDIAETLQGKNIMLIGSTGFVGKVAISMLLDRYPEIGKIVALVRPGMGNTAEDRFFKKVATSPAFDPVRDRYGEGFDAYLRDKVLPVGGDIGRPLCNFGEEDFEVFEKMGGVDAIINSAGLVSFTPSLESAIRINAKGARNCLDLARKLDASLVHISTCYVAGRRDGDVWEDEEVVGYFPRHDELVDDDFDADAEIADCDRVIEQVRDLAKDRRHISMFRERAQKTLRSQRRDPDDKATLKLSVARERKLWVHEKLTEVGMKRADHWGWSNTYTYSKSLGEQVVLKDKTVRSCIVRPAIVESSVSFPKPGWCEGFNTTAPLVYAMLKGQRLVVTGKNTNLDIIPVDMVCTAVIMATAAIIRNEHKAVYQAGSSGVNPVSSERLCELSGLAVRGYYRDKADSGVDTWKNRMRSRREAHPVSRETFYRFGTPQVKKLVDRVSKEIDERVPKWGAPRLAAFAERTQEELRKISTMSDQIVDLMDLFEPFIHDHAIAFRSDNLTALWARMPERDKDRLMWTPTEIDWRHYWIDSHFPGLIEWVFPVLDDEFGVKPRSVYTYKDMLELFDAAVKLNRHRVALRFLQTEEPDAPSVVYTYERMGELARQSSGNLRDWGVVPNERVAIMGEGRPEWSIGYFGILKAGATAVPMDSQLSLAEVANLLRASEARVFITSDKVCERLAEEEELDFAEGEERVAVETALGALSPESTKFAGYEDLLAEPEDSSPVVLPARKGDRVASLIFTSGTTGQPKGVMLTHKNLTSMAAKLSSTFRLYKHDGLLSVLPMHHTFEFSAGLLMPLTHGSSITYLDELNADALSAGFKCGHITGMVGVPALWQLLHRNVRKRISERGPLVERAFDAIVDVNRAIREKTPLEVDLGRLVFFPVHRELGGRIRLMISGGSALSPEVMKSFRGMGFRLFEGYGMTEASPVLAVQRPGDPAVAGSVGRALPGISVKVFEPNEDGIGELIGKGPNVMKGYYGNEDATDEVIRDGWLHTGDLGRIDEAGNVFIVGRKKEMILGASGENVYPDELEELYGEIDFVKELSIVGLPSDGTGETVAALVVPDYEHDEALGRAEVRDLVREHMKEVSKKLPLYKRVKLWHLWDHDLPRTSTRKVKRRDIVGELEKLEKVASSASSARKAAEEASDGDAGDTRWVRDVVAQVSQRKPGDVRPDSRMESLGFDSLMLTELAVALEAAGLRLPDPNVINELESVGDLETLAASQGLKVARDKAAKAIVAASEHAEDDDIKIPSPLANAGRAALGTGQGMLYSRYLDTKVRGKSFIPPFGGFIVAANHSSHLDMGLVKHTLGEHGDRLVALAAKDYFFEEPVRKAYFENFTNLLPMERHGSLRESLRLAGEVLREGYILLIFPEGTRSTTGIMTDFKPSIGYLAMTAGCGILPMYLGGTHDAMPKGAYLPKRQEVVSNVGPFQSYEALSEMSKGLKRSESYRHIAYRMEGMVRDMAPTRYEWTLGEAGRVPAAEAVAAARNEAGA
ncbi:MAG: AMP-binding protein [Myxococcales bacterium]|nr:AMP-binding protein [Myxococcales bacterium]